MAINKAFNIDFRVTTKVVYAALVLKRVALSGEYLQIIPRPIAIDVFSAKISFYPRISVFKSKRSW